MKTIHTLTFTFLTFISLLLYAASAGGETTPDEKQENAYREIQSSPWKWDWTASVSRKHDNLFPYLLFVDIQNNIYMMSEYSDTLVFSDTSFCHPENGYQGYIAISKHTCRGKFIQALDIRCMPGEFIWQFDLVVDEALNMYICGSFQTKIFIQDSVVQHGSGLNTWLPDLFIIKLDACFNVLWSRVISGDLQDIIHGITISNDGFLYLATEHLGNSSDTVHVDFFGQDSTTYHSTILSILKVDLNGNLIWRDEIQALSGYELGSGIIIGGDSNLYYYGRSINSLIIGGDTVWHPTYPVYMNLPFLIETDLEGNLLHAEIYNLTMNILDLYTDEAGNLLFSGHAYDTLILGQDTITSSGDSLISLLGKATPDWQPYWYELVRSGANQEVPWFKLAPGSDSLFFIASFNRDFTFAGRSFELGYYTEIMTGSFSYDGQFGTAFLTDCNYHCKGTEIRMDQCSNLYISGGFRNRAIFGEDTLTTFNPYIQDGFLAKICRLESPPPFLGPDTVACAMIILHGPDGYNFYSWNDGLSTEQNLTVTQSGTYWLGVGTSANCWYYDTILVIIAEPPVFCLGNDTIIALKDTITFFVPPGFEYYSWSTGDTTTAITLTGNSLGTGNHWIWAEITDGPCTTRDSLKLAVVWNPGIDEWTETGLQIRPNPSGGIFTLESDQTNVYWKITNLNGFLIQSGFITGTPPMTQILDLTTAPPGIYILEVIKGQEFVVKKLVKL